MLESILYHSTARKNDRFKNSKFIIGSWSSIVLSALINIGIDVNQIEIRDNPRKLKGAKYSEILYYNDVRVITLRNDKSLSANDVVDAFEARAI